MLWAERVRVAAFAVHAVAALCVMGVAFGCNVSRFVNWGYKSWPVARENATCGAQCWRESGDWVDDEPVPHHGWNPYGLVLVFEWVSTAFALFYLREHPWFRGKATWGAVGWLACGGGVYGAFYGVKGSGNWCEPLICFASLLAGAAVLWTYDRFEAAFLHEVREGVVEAVGRRFLVHQQNGYLWRVPPGLATDPVEADGHTVESVVLRLQKRLRIMLRYAEYSITAPLLFMAVLSLFVVGPPAWAFLGGYVGVFACNALGWPLHLMHVELKDGLLMTQPVGGGAPEQARDMGWAPRWMKRSIMPPKWPPPLKKVAFVGDPPAPSRREHAAHTAAAILGVGAWSEHWVARLAYLEGAWLGLAVAMLNVVYLGRPYLFNSAIPAVVLVALWNLLVSYCLFGVVGTFFYVRDGLWMYMDVAYDVLSLAAKIPIAGVVCVAFLSMPGGGCR